MCGIKGAVLELVRSYLSDRYFRVLYQSRSHSKWKRVQRGVPQGSVLGPLLFSLFCADIADAVQDAEITQSADDVNLVASGENAAGAVEPTRVGRLPAGR